MYLLNSAKYLVDIFSTLLWIYLIHSITPSNCFPKAMSSFCSKIFLATLIKASSGHSVNQSIVQQFTKDGNILNLVTNFSPTGDMAKIICILDITLFK